MFKNASGIINVLKLVVKYGAYIVVIIDVVNFAIEKFQDADEKHGKKYGNISEPAPNKGLKE